MLTAAAALAALDRRRFMCNSSVPQPEVCGKLQSRKKVWLEESFGYFRCPPDVNALFFNTPSARHVGRHPGDQFPLQVNCVFV